MKYIIYIILSSLLHVNIVYAGTATGQLTFLFKVVPMCAIQGVLIPVQDKKECLQKQKEGNSREIIIKDDVEYVTY